jgi:hypothetical protein
MVLHNGQKNVNNAQMPAYGKDRWHCSEARLTIEVKAGTKCFCRRLGLDPGISVYRVKVSSEQEQKQCDTQDSNLDL